MNRSLLRRVRVHGRRPLLVVAVVLGAFFSLAPPAGADGVPVDPVPVGVWPLLPTPRVIRAFDRPGSPWDAGHRGVDLAGAVGQVVHTALGGRVEFASPLAGRGVVVVDHGSTRTTYEPVASLVRVGQLLARGQPIGTLELTGSHCAPRACLHWGWKRGPTYLDPLQLVGGVPIVLLPWGLPAAPSAVVPLAPPYAWQAAARSTWPRVSFPRLLPATTVWRRPLAMRPLLM